jgi:hypothetical protein
MIGRVAGILVEKNFPQVVVSCNGVGYEIDVPMSTFYPLPRTGEEVTLLTHLVVREDAHLLYGFLTAAERGTFRQLLKISGVGPKVALSVLSGLSVEDLGAVGPGCRAAHEDPVRENRSAWSWSCATSCRKRCPGRGATHRRRAPTW